MPAEKMHLGETITQAKEPLLPQEGSNRRESSLGPSKGRSHEDRGPGKLRATRGGSGSLGWAQEASGGPRTLSERGGGWGR